MQQKTAFFKMSILLILAVCLLSLVAVSAGADSWGDWEYTVNNEQVIITSYTGYSSSVTIPSSIGGYPVIKVGTHAFRNMGFITSLTIPDGVTDLGYEIISGTSIESITIPKTVSRCEYHSGYNVSSFSNSSITSISFAPGTTVIPGNICRRAAQLSNVSIPDGVTTIQGSAFDNCTSLESISLPDSMLSIGDWAFTGTSLETFEIPENVTHLGCAFISGTKVTSITFPESVESFGYHSGYNYSPLSASSVSSVVFATGRTVIQSNACHNVPNLTDVSIPVSVVEIGSSAFQGCPKLESVALPKYLTKIGDWAFNGTAFTTFEIPNYVTHLGCAFLGGTKVSSITIPKSVESFGYHSGYNYSPLSASDITSVVFATGRTVIQSNACHNVPNLTDVSIPVSVVEIRSSAFQGCPKLESIALPKYLTKIGDWALNGTGLTALEIPKYVTHLGVAFIGGTKISSITIPKSVESCGFHSGYNYGPLSTSNVVSVIFEPGRTFIPNYTCYWTPKMTSVSIPDGITEIGRSAFDRCVSLEAITLPDSLTKIGDYAFAVCSTIKECVIPETVTSIGIGLFAECSSLETYTFPSGITTIPNRMFDGCFSLPSITWGKNVTTIGESAFRNCDSLTNVVIPATITKINSYAFYSCDELVAVTIPGTVSYTGYQAFADCDNLITAIIKNGVQIISNSTFLNCDLLENVSIPVTVHTIEPYAFKTCGSLAFIDLSSGLKTIQSGAFQECYSLSDVVIYPVTTEIADNAFSYPEEITVHGYTGSYAEAYAAEHDMPFAIAISISQQPEDISAPAGSEVVFAIVADGIQSLSYQWQYSTDMGNTWITPSDASAKTANYSFTMKEAYDGYMYHCIISDGRSRNVSGMVTLTLKPILKTLILPASLVTIEAEAFTGDAAQMIVIPDSVTTIASCAFASCKNLTILVFEGNPQSIASDILQNCSDVTIQCSRGGAVDQWATANGYTVQYN